MLISAVYALADRQVVLEFEVDAGTSARQAALSSGLQEYFQDLDLSVIALGVYGESVEDGYQMQAGDRLELYRDLVMDPMELRRQRATSESPVRKTRRKGRSCDRKPKSD